MSLKKGTFYVFISNLINLVISLFTGFVLPAFLSINTYSNIKLFQLYIAYIGVVSLGFADGMYLKYGGMELSKINKKELKDEFLTYSVFQFVIFIICVMVSLFFKNYILFFCSLVILPINISGYLKNLYQSTGKFDLYSKFMNISTFLIFLVNFFLILIIKTDNYILYLIGYVFAYFLYLIFVLTETNKVMNYSDIKSKVDLKYLFEDIKNGFSLMIGNFGSIIFTSIDRVFVKMFLGSIQFAFYSFAVSIENLVNVFLSPFSVVMYNYFSNHKKSEDVIKIKNILLIFAAFLIALVFPVKWFVINFIPKYTSSLSILFFLMGAQFLSILIKCIHTNLYKAYKRQNEYFIIMLIMIVLSVILNIVVYYTFGGLISFAIATLLTNLVWLIIGEIKFKESVMNIKSYLYIFLIVIFYIGLQYLNNVYLALTLYLLIALLLSIILLNKYMSYLIEEIKMIIKLIRKKNKSQK